MARLTLGNAKDSGSFPEQEVSLGDRGTILCRGFSKGMMNRMRNEAMQVSLSKGIADDLDTETIELYLFKYGIVEPNFSELTDNEIREIFESWPASTCERVMGVIVELNGAEGGFIRSQTEAFRS